MSCVAPCPPDHHTPHRQLLPCYMGTGSSREFCHNIIWQLNNWSRDNNLELFKPDISSEFLYNWSIPLNEGVQYGKSCNISALFWLLGTIDCSHISQSVLFYSQQNRLSKQQSGKCIDQIVFPFIKCIGHQLCCDVLMLIWPFVYTCTFKASLICNSLILCNAT